MSDTKSIGKYDIVAELGRGGMGVVYKAWEESLQRFVAIKMLGDQLTHDENIVQRFLREARAVADLNHPNIVQVFAVDTHEGRPYFAMEYVEGESLTELIRTSQRVEPRRAVQLIKEAANGLAAAHAKDVVHRDIKPDNIMLTKHGGVKVVDFGIAKVDDPDSKLTATGMMVGTPNYISPEVCLGQDVDSRSDIFSLGIVFFEMLAGETPFQADSPMAMMTAVVQAEVPDITVLNPEVDSNIRLVLAQMLQKDPTHRYQSCQQLAEDLETYLAGEPPKHALGAANEAPTMQISRPAIDAATVQRPAAAAASGGKRATQLGWVVGLLLIVGAAAGSWYYVEQPGPPPTTSGGLSAQDDEQLDSPVAEADVIPAAETSAESGEAVATQTDNSTGLTSVDTAASSEILDEPSSIAPVDEAPLPVAVAQDVTSQQSFAEPSEQPIQVAALRPSRQSAPQPVAPAPSGPPKMVVIALGDPAISSVVESVFESALMNAEYPVLDENFFDNMNFNNDLASIGRAVQANGGDILVFADIRETGQRRLSFYGRTEFQILANMQVRAMMLSEKRSLGAPWIESLEYVPLNAADTAKEVAEPIADEIVERLLKLKPTS